MQYRAKRLIGRAAQTAAFYRFVPAGPIRVFSGLRYHYAHKNWFDVTQLARTDLRHTTNYRSSGLLTARAAFYTAEDELAESVIERLMDRFPAEPRLFDLRADMRRFHGRYGDALADAERARFLVPSSRNAVAKVMQYSYFANPPDIADRINLDELRRYPRSTRLYLAAAHGCRDSVQFQRLLRLWREFEEPRSIIAKVVPLALAAERAGEMEAACQLYRDAIRCAAEAGFGEDERRLPDFLAVSDVSSDIDDVMTTAAIPYAYVGATALAIAHSHGNPYVASDGTVELGVLENDWDHSSLEKLFSADPRFAPQLQHPKAPGIEVVHRSNVNVRILRFYTEGGKLWHDRIGSRIWNTPFKVEVFRSGRHTFQLPSDLSTYLQQTYGDAAAPASRMSDNTSNVEVTWPEYARLNGLRRAFELVRAGELTRAVDELMEAEEAALARAIEASHG